jgi:hypothetical protein
MDVLLVGLETSPGAWKFLMEMFLKTFDGVERDGCSLFGAGDFPWSFEVLDRDVSFNSYQE